MELLTVTIPCYNSQDYMEHAIDSLLDSIEDLDIIIVDDGSTDKTAAIANRYAKDYPEHIRAIHQENGGHGAAVMTGIEYAKGVYFKVLDSDDWLDKDSLKKLLDTMKQQKKSIVDMYISNYVYENERQHKTFSVTYENAMPKNRVFSWDELGKMKKSQNILMHSVVYRTAILRQCGLNLPKHTFYVDNLYVFEPLNAVKRMFYVDVDLYRYYIGREDQSVNENRMIERIDQQIFVTKRMINDMTEKVIEEENLYQYMVKYLVMMMSVSSALLMKANTAESLRKKEELWMYFKHCNPKLYKETNHYFLGVVMKVDSLVGRKLVVAGYRFMQKKFCFN